MCSGASYGQAGSELMTTRKIKLKLNEQGHEKLTEKNEGCVLCAEQSCRALAWRGWCRGGLEALFVRWLFSNIFCFRLREDGREDPG